MSYESINWFEQGSRAAEFMREWEAEITEQWERLREQGFKITVTDD